MAADTVDTDDLAALLGALAYPLRLDLLQVLQYPHTVSQIKVSARRAERDRPAARQTVQGHLDRMMETGIVEAESVLSGGKQVPSYTANPMRLYAILDALRTLIVRQAMQTDAALTGTMVSAGTGADVTGPRLVVTQGMDPGHVYRLDGDDAAEWVIGRGEGCALRLDYDPFLSTKNTRVARGDDGFVVEDLGSKNGTHVNWTPLLSGPRGLRPGDVLGVGRSILVYAE